MVLSENTNSYILSCKTNVYGPDCDTTLRWCILKDLTAVAAQTICAGNGRFCGRLHLGEGVLANHISDSGNWVKLSKGEESVFLSCNSRSVLDMAMSAPRGIEQIPVKRLRWNVKAKDGTVCSVVALGISRHAASEAQEVLMHYDEAGQVPCAVAESCQGYGDRPSELAKPR